MAQEHNLYQIFCALKKYPRLDRAFNHFIPLRILDVGCRVPIFAYNLYHNLSQIEFTGVDTKNEQDCVANFIEYMRQLKYEKINELVSCHTFFDVYQVMIHPHDNEKAKIESKEFFDQIFLKNFHKMRIGQFFQLNSAKIDLVIASDIFHIMHKLSHDSIFQNIKNAMAEDALLIGRVQDQGKGSMFTPEIYEEFKEKFYTAFPDGEIHEYPVGGQWHHSVFLSRGGMLGR